MRTLSSHADKLLTPIKEIAITNKFALINTYMMISRIPLNREFTTSAMDFVMGKVRYCILKEFLERNVLTIRKVAARKIKSYMPFRRGQKFEYFAMSQCLNERSQPAYRSRSHHTIMASLICACSIFNYNR